MAADRESFNRSFKSPEWNRNGPRNSKSSDRASYSRFSNDFRDRPSEIARKQKTSMLAISFCLMIFIGSGNKIFQKLQTVPMYNYPNFLNLLATFAYIPLSFAYIVPVAKYGWLNNAITPEQLALPKKPFAVMGLLDSMAGIMQIFAATYLDGPLLILLSQSAIPFSMVLSSKMLGAVYKSYQFVGAFVVIAGLVTVLAPVMFGAGSDASCTFAPGNETEYCVECQDVDGVGGNELNCTADKHCVWQIAGEDSSGSTSTLIWATVMMLSCIPMCLSSIYKEVALGETELDPIFLNGWIALFQFFFSIPLAVPAAWITGIVPADLPSNLWNGLRCWVGIESIDDGCHPDSCGDLIWGDSVPQSIAFVNTYLVFNLSYNVLIILILKFGSANILWLAMTVMVPIGNLSFALPIMPEPSTFKATDIIGLCVIMGGLCMYRFGEGFWENMFGGGDGEDEDKDEGFVKKPLLSPFAEGGGAMEGGGDERDSRSRADSAEIGRIGKSF